MADDEAVSDQAFEHLRDLLPPYAMPEFAVRLVGYIDHDGESSYALQLEGDVPFSHTLGMLLMALHEQMHEDA